MTLIQALRWTGSKRAEGWLGRRTTSADFAHLAEMCTDIARALATHRDVDANALLARLETKLGAAKKTPVFGGR